MKRIIYKMLGNIILFLFGASILVTIGIFSLLIYKSPGKPKSFLDADCQKIKNSISEKIHVLINGVQQGMFITGKDINNPVLLFMHGGAGMPEYFLTGKYPTGMEEYFTVCWWDRRGAGLSYSSDIPQETMTIEQMISDAIEVTNYLRNRFDKDKIYLMAHSGGTVFAIQVAARAPELYSAYIGISQITHQLKSEKLSYEYMLQKYNELGNKKMVRKLEAGPVTMTVPLPVSYMKVRDKAMHSLGVGTMREMRSVITGVFLTSWLNPEYTIREKFAIWRGKFFSDKILWDKMIAVDLTRIVQEADLPVYFFHGKYDYTVSYPLAKEFLKGLRAPVKGFYTFNESAHSPMFEEPLKMKDILVNDVINSETNLADKI